MVAMLGQAVLQAFVSAPTRFGIRRQAAQARGRRFMALGSDGQELSVAELAGKLRDKGLQGSSPKIGAIFADFVEKLQEAVAEEAAEVPGSPADASASSAKPSSSSSPPVPAQGEVLLKELAALSPRVSREDYFDEASQEWDVEGLEHDLQLSRKQAATTTSAAQPAKTEASQDVERAEKMLAELTQLDPAVSRGDYFDDESNQWDIEGLEHDLELSKKQAVTATPAAQPAKAEASQGAERAEKILAELMQLDPDVSRGDYFDDGSNQWDIEGLENDLELSKKQAAPATPAAQPAKAEASQGAQRAEKILAELMQLDPGVSRGDYFDDGSNEWDIEGLENDLELTKKQAAPATPAAQPAKAEASQGAERAEKLLAELAQLDPVVSRGDYFDGESNQWDIEGLEHDLELSRKATLRPAAASSGGAGSSSTDVAKAEEMLAELIRLDPLAGASKPDYFDEASQEWDMEGLTQDLALSKEHAGTAAPVPPQTAAASISSLEPQTGSGGPEELLAELGLLVPGVSRGDYFDKASQQWDIEGLEHDLEISRREKEELVVAADSAPLPAPAAVTPEQLFAKLQKLSSTAGKEDYFDEASGDWDLEGLRDDLSLAEKEAPQTGASADDMLAQLSALDSRVGKADYFDSTTGQWDLDGLQEDLQLAQSTSAGSRGTDPETLLAQLSELSPGTSREDYFDQETSQWDLEGLQEDLRLSKERQLTAA